jgi:ABC-type uncharacterized transport system substrate-binding protein
MRRLLRTACACLVAISAGQAAAHPHVWVTMKSQVVYAPDGAVSELRHTWTFDQMFSTFATQGIKSNQKGAFTREELQPLADVQISSLKDFAYFTFARINGETVQLSEPTDYWLDFNEGALSLTFSLALKDGKPTPHRLEVDIHDPSTFVDLTFGKDNPVTLVGAPASCKGAFARPNENLQDLRFGDPYFESTPSEYGSRILNKIRVRCP